MSTHTEHINSCKPRRFAQLGILILGLCIGVIVLLAASVHSTSASASSTRAREAPPACNGTLPRKLCEAIRHHTKHPEWANNAALARIVYLESTNNPRAVNSSSGACGLFQFLPCRCFATIVQQARCGVRYIEGRYRSPENALHFHYRVGWY